MNWEYDKPTGRPKSKLLLIVVVILVISTAVTGYWMWKLHNNNKARTPVNSSTQKPSQNSRNSQFSSVSGRYLFNGTVTWARAVERSSRLANGTYDYAKPFSQLNTFNRQQYDAWSTDFECPITDNTVSYQTQIDNLIFNCRPEFLPEAVKYFNLFDLANNHTDNQNGTVGLTKTRQYLDKAGVQYFGSFDPSVSNDVCEVVALPVRLQKADKTEEKASLPVAFCAWHYFYRKPLAGEIEVMQKYAKIMPVFAFVEMGAEYHPSADAIQQEIAHEVVDQGPEFLLANNPHWVQNTEVYKGKLIVYSMGNFIFDQLDAETNRSASIDATITVPYDENVAKWLALAPKCSTFHDDCLTEAQQQGLTKYKLQLKYGVVAGQGGNNQISHKADTATQTAVEQRLNWSQTCTQLGYNSCQ